MSEAVGTLHFLALVGLTGSYLEARIEPLPQWTAPIAIALFLALTLVYAGAVAIGYGAT